MYPPRTTIPQVQKLLKNDWNPDHDVSPYIETASNLADKIQAFADENTNVFTDATTMELVERWLSAHFYMVMNQEYSSKRAEGGAASFQGKSGMYLTSTIYGQQAVVLDSTGYLATIAESPRKMARLVWQGKNPSEQIPYCQRR